MYWSDVRVVLRWVKTGHLTKTTNRRLHITRINSNCCPLHSVTVATSRRWLVSSISCAACDPISWLVNKDCEHGRGRFSNIDFSHTRADCQKHRKTNQPPSDDLTPFTKWYYETWEASWLATQYIDSYEISAVVSSQSAENVLTTIIAQVELSHPLWPI